MIRVPGRYGRRSSNKMGKQRDPSFWIVGTHVEWEIHPSIELMVAYHDERGLADRQYQPQFEEDF